MLLELLQEMLQEMLHKLHVKAVLQEMLQELLHELHVKAMLQAMLHELLQTFTCNSHWSRNIYALQKFKRKMLQESAAQVCYIL